MGARLEVQLRMSMAEVGDRLDGFRAELARDVAAAADLSPAHVRAEAVRAGGAGLVATVEIAGAARDGGPRDGVREGLGWEHDPPLPRLRLDTRGGGGGGGACPCCARARSRTRLCGRKPAAIA